MVNERGWRGAPRGRSGRYLRWLTETMAELLRVKDRGRVALLEQVGAPGGRRLHHVPLPWPGR